MADKNEIVVPEPVQVASSLPQDDDLGGLSPSATLFLDKKDDPVLMTQEQHDRAMALPEVKRLMLFAFCKAGTIAGACSLLRDEKTGMPIVSASRHQRWVNHDGEYRKLFEELSEFVDERWRQVIEERAGRGVEEREYATDKDGNERLVRRRVRDDARLLLSVVAARHPEYRREQGGGTNINVVVIRTDE